MENNEAILKDRFGRVHDYLRISLTERCNLRCFYCMPEDGIQLREKNVFMSVEETLAIAKSFVQLGVKKIRLTGGEPLIKKGIEEILLGLGELNVEVALTTNGVCLDQYFAVLQSAGVKSLNISLDSLKEEKVNQITRRNFYHRIMKNIEDAVLLGFIVKINAVIIKGVNDDEIIDFVEWAGKIGVQIRFIEFMPFDGNNWNWDKKVSYAQMMDILASHYGEQIDKIIDQPNDTSRNYKIYGSKGSFGFISSVTNPFCDTCNRIRLTADGKIKNCLFSQDETDLLSAYRSGKNLISLIKQAVLDKKKARGGLVSFEDPSVLLHKNRTMVSIGG